MKHTHLFFINKLMKLLYIDDLNGSSNSFVKSGYNLRNFKFDSKVLHIKDMILSRMTKFILLGVLYQIMKTKVLFQNLCIITKVDWDVRSDKQFSISIAVESLDASN